MNVTESDKDAIKKKRERQTKHYLVCMTDAGTQPTPAPIPLRLIYGPLVGGDSSRLTRDLDSRVRSLIFVFPSVTQNRSFCRWLWLNVKEGMQLKVMNKVMSAKFPSSLAPSLQITISQL